MHPEHQSQTPDQRDEARLRQLEEDMRALRGQISQIEARVRNALDQVRASTFLNP